MKGLFIVVDDDLAEQEMFTFAMRRLGYSNPVKFFDNCEAALQFLFENDEDIFMIISDVHMPGMSGLEFKKTIEEVPILKAKSIPFIFHSSTSAPSEVKRAYGLNIQGFFLKTTELEESVQMLKKTIEYWSSCFHPKDLKYYTTE